MLFMKCFEPSILICMRSYIIEPPSIENVYSNFFMKLEKMLILEGVRLPSISVQGRCKSSDLEA